MVGVSLPVRIFEPRSLLERVSDGWISFIEPLEKCVVNNYSSERRIACVLGCVINGLSRACNQLKPFNPILGETF